MTAVFSQTMQRASRNIFPALLRATRRDSHSFPFVNPQAPIERTIDFQCRLDGSSLVVAFQKIGDHSWKELLRRSSSVKKPVLAFLETHDDIANLLTLEGLLPELRKRGYGHLNLEIDKEISREEIKQTKVFPPSFLAALEKNGFSYQGVDAQMEAVMPILSQLSEENFIKLMYLRDIVMGNNTTINALSRPDQGHIVQMGCGHKSGVTERVEEYLGKGSIVPFYIYSKDPDEEMLEDKGVYSLKLNLSNTFQVSQTILELVDERIESFASMRSTDRSV